MSKQKTVLFFGLHRPNRSPSQRYRIEQFLPFLEEKGISYDYQFLLNEKRDKAFYTPKNYIAKLFIVLYSVFKLFQVTFFQAKNYKYIFVQREAFMLGTAFFEKQMAKRSQLIFDFDDAIWMQNVSEANKKLAFLKNAAKTSEIIAVAETVVVGNQFLADYALQFNKNVIVIPTCIDTDEYQKQNEKIEKEKVCIGWSGSQTTIEHFKLMEPVLKQLKEKYDNKIFFKVIGDENYINEEIGIKGIKWGRDTEIKELEAIDIGIMPLPNDEWTKGKCGLKGLVYMSMEIPTVMQNVGVNSEIVQNGENGFLVLNEKEWVKTLSILIGDAQLRREIGEKGRKTVLDKYSINKWKNNFLNLFS